MAKFSLPWWIAFVPDRRMLVTEEIGPIWLVSVQVNANPGALIHVTPK